MRSETGGFVATDERRARTLTYDRDTLPFPGNLVPPVSFEATQDWNNLDPARHPFVWDDEEEARLHALIRPWVPPVLSGSAGRWQCEWWCEEQVDAVVRERYGSWAFAWRWDLGFGGHVNGWGHVSTAVTTPEATAARASAALLNWRRSLEWLARRFAELAPPPDASPEDRSWYLERACVRLVTVALDSGTDSWPGQSARLLRWFLTSTGMDQDEAGRVVEATIGGRFESWVAPARPLLDSVGEDFAVELTGHLPYRDHRERADLEDFHDNRR
ncbi:hypothetical protein [Streptomyces populi]|uniref:hypothetical protein n=1 Tax=Streptomyces populi TaxID=2058924 RepID=UPI001F0CD2D3|nr:hypothetical protein [Streptomyces populi]